MVFFLIKTVLFKKKNINIQSELEYTYIIKISDTELSNYFVGIVL